MAQEATQLEAMQLEAQLEATQLEATQLAEAAEELFDGRQPEEEEKEGLTEAEQQIYDTIPDLYSTNWEEEEDKTEPTCRGGRESLGGSCFNCGARQENCASPTCHKCGTCQDMQEESEEEEEEEDEDAIPCGEAPWHTPDNGLSPVPEAPMSDSSGAPPPGLVDSTRSSRADAGMQGGQPSPVDSSSSEEDGGRKGSKNPDGKGKYKGGRISDGKGKDNPQDSDGKDKVRGKGKGKSKDDGPLAGGERESDAAGPHDLHELELVCHLLLAQMEEPAAEPGVGVPPPAPPGVADPPRRRT